MDKEMTREEELKGLQAMYEEIASIPDDEIFDYFYKNSPSFRNDFLKFAGEMQVSASSNFHFEFKETYSMSYSDSSYSSIKKSVLSEGDTWQTAA